MRGGEEEDYSRLRVFRSWLAGLGVVFLFVTFTHPSSIMSSLIDDVAYHHFNTISIIPTHRVRPSQFLMTTRETFPCEEVFPLLKNLHQPLLTTKGLANS